MKSLFTSALLCVLLASHSAAQQPNQSSPKPRTPRMTSEGGEIDSRATVDSQKPPSKSGDESEDSFAPTPKVGEDGQMSVSYETTPLFAYIHDFVKALEAGAAGDGYGLVEAVKGADLYRVTKLTKVRVIEEGDRKVQDLWVSFIKVRVLEGPHKGKTGWTLPARVKRY